MIPRNLAFLLLLVAVVAGVGFMGTLMYDMTRHVGLMTGHVASLSQDVGSISQKMGEMTEHLAHMDQNMEQMTGQMGQLQRNTESIAGYMGRMDQTIHRGSETIQRWNPMEMFSPKGMGGQ